MRIRNFCIIAHIDHGKSTLADRLLDLTGTVSKREMKDQMLDSMDLEREKGITIKMQPVRMEYHSPKDGEDYILNLIDTPGHVDFSYEVSRSLQACEGALLVVDATQGIQAQTLANLYLAVDAGLEIVPIINKIDLPSADVPRVAAEIMGIVGCTEEEILKISAKTGEGVPAVLDAAIERIPEPIDSNVPGLQALVFDSVYDDYMGVIAHIRVFSGELKRGQAATFIATKAALDVLEVGVFKPKRVKQDVLRAGDVGYVATGLKDVRDCRVGDTISSAVGVPQLPGYRPVLPMVFASLYPTSADAYFDLRDALGKLQLNDAALSFEPESAPALGRGFRCGFLGMLHMEIVTERLEREFDLDLILTTPSVSYLILLRDGSEKRIYNAEHLPDLSGVAAIKEPWMRGEVIVPSTYVGSVMELLPGYRGVYRTTEYLQQTRAILHFEIPLSSLITDFFDRLKSVTQGYGSLSYEFLEEREEDLVKLDILVAGERVSAFARLVPQGEAEAEGRRIVIKLKDVIPPQNFAVPLQAAIGGKVIARETIKAMRKDVTAKLYGGDVTRKKKLLAKQKKGKKRMATMGKVEIPQEAFLAVLKREE